MGDRVEAALAIIAALALVYQYVNVGAIGPLPNMYDPLRYPGTRTATAIGLPAAVDGPSRAAERRRPREKQSAPRENRSPS